MQKVIGHEKIKRRLLRMLERKVAPSALLFSGPEGVGKFTLAWEFAKSLLQLEDDKEMSLRAFILKPAIEEKNGKEREKAIGIEEIRKLQRYLGLTAGFGSVKVAIIDRAEKMTIGAQNALLKTLEEAETGTVIILISQDNHKILSTVLSRCQQLKFNLVSDEEIGKIIDLNSSKKEAILFWSIGRPGLALNLQEKSEEMEFRKEAFSEFRMLFQKTSEQKFFLAEKLSKDIPTTIKKIDLWVVILRRVILGLDKNGSLSKNKAFSLIERLQEAKDKFEDTNANAKLILENLFLNF